MANRTLHPIRILDRGASVARPHNSLTAAYSIDEVETKKRRFGASTLEALRTFQRDTGLTINGIATADTFSVLHVAAKKRRLSARGDEPAVPQAPPGLPETPSTIVRQPAPLARVAAFLLGEQPTQPIRPAICPAYRYLDSLPDQVPPRPSGDLCRFSLSVRAEEEANCQHIEDEMQQRPASHYQDELWNLLKTCLCRIALIVGHSTPSRSIIHGPKYFEVPPNSRPRCLCRPAPCSAR